MGSFVNNALGTRRPFLGSWKTCLSFLLQSYGSRNRKQVGAYVQKGTCRILKFCFSLGPTERRCAVMLLLVGGFLVVLNSFFDRLRKSVYLSSINVAALNCIYMFMFECFASLVFAIFW